MKIKLYTCENGINLFKHGITFGAWKKDTESYRDAHENYAITVDSSDLKPNNHEDGGYKVTNIKSVEIVDEGIL